MYKKCNHLFYICILIVKIELRIVFKVLQYKLFHVTPKFLNIYITLSCHSFVTIGRGCYSWVTVVSHGCRSEVWGHYVPIRHRFKLGVTLYRKVTRTWRLLSGTSPLWTLWVDLLTDVRDRKFIGFSFGYYLWLIELTSQLWRNMIGMT